MTSTDLWRGRLGTAVAMAYLVRARVAVAVIPFKTWRSSLGLSKGVASDGLRSGERLASQLERAAQRLPFEAKCLPRAAALSWLLRREGIAHAVVLAIRPKSMRDLPDPLHAWVEIDGAKIIGDLPGPWVETLRLGES